MNIAVVTSSPPGTEGGHLVIARALADALARGGHTPHLVITPDYGFGRLTSTYRASWTTDVMTIDGCSIDRVVSLRYPSFAVRHPHHVCWLNHTMREYYDLWPRFAASISWRNRLKEAVRRQTLHAVDGWLLHRNVTRVVAQSKTIQQRLAAAFDLRAEVVYPPPPLGSYQCLGYDDFIFAVSRLDPLKRVDLLIRALAELPARHVNAVIAGDGECAGDLQALARSLGVANRVRFLGRVDEPTMLDCLARCRAVCFTPYAEDFGFVTVEAFASRKAVITCRDSGGPTELVLDDGSGVVCEPTAASVAIAVARLVDDRVLAERLGSGGAAQAATMTWDRALEQLLSV